MSKEVVNKEANELAEISLDAFGGSEMVDAQDLVMPKLRILQGLSDLVTSGEARFGDIYDAGSGKVVGNMKDVKLDIIPFYMEKLWIVSKYDASSDKYKFVRFDPVNSTNIHREWEEVINGEKFKNDFNYRFYAMIPALGSMPYIIDMKGKSRRVGKQLVTMMYVTNKAEGKIPPYFTIELGGISEKNDKGTYSVFTVRRMTEKPAPVATIKEALGWYKSIQSGAAKVDDSDIMEEENSGPKPQF